jgi:4,5:9,10-diseco-3-hydroxy-5,9,17-trioxoandrosta-1(10),2-diene-4-oate hydrolase
MGDMPQSEHALKSHEAASPYPADLFIRVSGTRIRYWDIGTGSPPILLVHGIGTFCETWLMNVHGLSEHFRVIALDLPGHGNSEPLDTIYDAETYARFLNDFQQVLGIDRAALIGNSFGGTVVVQMAWSYPERVSRLVLVAAAGIGGEVSLGFRILGLPVIGNFLLRPRGNEALKRKRSEAILRTILHNPEDLDTIARNRLLDKYAEMAGTPGAGRAVHEVLAKYTNLFGIRRRYVAESREKLAAITAPALIIWGEDDPVLPVHHAGAGQSALRNAKLHVLKDCGHLPQLEYATRFNELVLDFLRTE